MTRCRIPAVLLSVIILSSTGCGVNISHPESAVASEETVPKTSNVSLEKIQKENEMKLPTVSETVTEETREISKPETDRDTAYIFPDSDTTWISYDEMKDKTTEELRIGRNEIYARHGRKFASKDLQDYFGKQTWYHGTVASEDFDEWQLNQYERDNISIIKNLEFQRKLAAAGETYQVKYAKTSDSTGNVYNEHFEDTIDIRMPDIDTVELVYHGNMGNELSEYSGQKLIFKRVDLSFEYPDDVTFSWKPSVSIGDNGVTVYEEGADCIWNYKKLSDL